MLTEIGKYQANYTGGSKASEQSGVKVSTVELKTSKPHVTRTAQIKTGFQSIGDYTRYLQGRYSYVNAGQTSISGIPTTVSVSPAFLEKCNKDPQKAAFLEENLAVIPNGVDYLQNHVRLMGMGSPVVTYVSYDIDSNGNITMASGSTNDPDGRIARENAERKAKEQQLEKEKRKAARDEEAKKERALERRSAEKRHQTGQTSTHTTTVSGSDIFVATDKLIAALLPTGGLDLMI